MIDYEYRGGVVVSPPETRFTPKDGRVCCVLRLGQADYRRGEDANFDRVREHYFTVKVWPVRSSTGEVALPSLVAESVQQGDHVVVRGKFETKAFTNRRGDEVQTTDFVANAVYVDVRAGGSSAGSGGDESASAGAWQ